VTAAGLTSTLPIQDGATDRFFTIVGRQLPPGEHLDAEIRIVSGDYFKTMGIAVLSGREFAESDTRLSPRVIMINATLASQYFPNENPIGQRIDIGNGAATVVGVAQSVRQLGVEQAPKAEFYLPASQERYHSQTMAVVIETRGDPTAIEQSVRGLVRAVDPERPIYELGTMASVVAASLAPRRMLLVLLVLFAMLAVALAATGLYGVLSYTVAQRTREIGIRIALGAGTTKIAGMVLVETGRVVGIGLAMGLLVALLGAGVLQSLLYGISPHDPLTFIATPAMLAVVAFVASLVPALRAARVDPIVSMRAD
jgi:predicted permease